MSLLRLDNMGFFVFVVIMIIMTIYVIRDHNKKRQARSKPLVSFIMPTYNDGKYIEESIKSIFNSYEKKKIQLIVINDKSKDNTSEILKKLKLSYPIKIINNEENIGKAKSINNSVKYAKGEIICIIDSDLHLNEKAMNDMLARLERKEIGGVSCRYVPINKGFLASMQRVEYGLHSLILTSHNPFSTTSLWGGCMAIKKEVFKEVGMLTENCIIEDADLALKIGETGYKAEECTFPVHTYVPNSLSSWYNQKIRWAAGGMQNILNHWKFFLKHPIAIMFLISYLLLSMSFILSLINNLIYVENFVALFESISSVSQSFLTAVSFIKIANIFHVVKILGVYFLYPLFSIPYVLINYPVRKKPFSLLLVFPFAIIYMSLLIPVHLIGFVKGIYKTITLKKNERAW